MRNTLYIILLVLLSFQVHSQTPGFISRFLFLDTELDLIGDSSSYSIGLYDYFPPRECRHILIEFSTDSIAISNVMALPFSLYLISRNSSDSILFTICDNWQYDNGQLVLRAYAAIQEKDIPGGREFLLKDILNNYANLENVMKNAFDILYYNKKMESYAPVDIPQLEAISPRWPNEKKLKFYADFCPIDITTRIIFDFEEDDLNEY